MEHTGLPKDWAFRPAFDVELKQYTLLAYLQRVRDRFAHHRLYPHLEDLKDHILELERVRKEKELLARQLGTHLVGFDPRTGDAVHEPIASDAWLSVVDEVIDWAVPGLHEARALGLELRAEIADRIAFAPVGLLPLDPSAGWLLLRIGSEARAYAYHLSRVRFTDQDPDALRVRTTYVTSYTLGLGCTFEWIKADLVRTHRVLPNPAVFAFETDQRLPWVETYMPLAKRLVYEQVTRTS